MQERKATKASEQCQVEGCEAALPEDRVYYKRYKICPYHSGLPAMTLGGRTMRWCQQCGKFQTLEEFEGDRRSCRRVLEQHNARRRNRATPNTVPTARAASRHESPPPRKSKAQKSKGGSSAGGSGGGGASPSSLLASPFDQAPTASFGGTGSGRGVAAGAGPRCAAGNVEDDMPRWPSDITDHTSFRMTAGAGADTCCPGDGLAPPLLLRQLSICGSCGALDAGTDDADSEEEAVLPGRPNPQGLVLDQLMADAELQDMLSWLPEFLETSPQQQQQQQQQAGAQLELPQRATQAKHSPQVQQRGAGPTSGPGVQLGYLQPLPLPQPPSLAPSLRPPGGAAAVRADGASAAAQVSQEAQDAPEAGRQPSEELLAPLALGESLPDLPWGPDLPLLLTSARMQLDPLGDAIIDAVFRESPVAGAALAPGVAPPSARAATRSSSRLQQKVSALPLEHPPLPVAGLAQEPGPEARAARGAERQPSGAPCHSVSFSASVPPSPLEYQEHMVRLSLKLFNITPDQLPDGLREEVVGLITADPVFVDTFVRPGCTHLTIDATVGEEEAEALRQAGAEGVAQQLLRRGGWLAGDQGDRQGWAENMLVQLGGQVAVVREGRVMAVVDVQPMAPHLVAVRPAAILAQTLEGAQFGEVGYRRGGEPGAASGRIQQSNGEAQEEGVVTLWGYGISGSHDMVVCRQGGRVLDLEIIARGKLPANPGLARQAEFVRVRPLRVGVGLVQFEVQRGGVLSEAVSLVALPSREAVAKAQQAQRELAGTPHQATFLRAVGMLLSQQQAQAQQQQQQQGFPATEALASVGSPSQALSRPASLALGLRVLAQANGWWELARLLLADMPRPAATPTAAHSVAGGASPVPAWDQQGVGALPADPAAGIPVGMGHRSALEGGKAGGEPSLSDPQSVLQACGPSCTSSDLGVRSGGLHLPGHALALADGGSSSSSCCEGLVPMCQFHHEEPSLGAAQPSSSGPPAQLQPRCAGACATAAECDSSFQLDAADQPPCSSQCMELGHARGEAADADLAASLLAIRLEEEEETEQRRGLGGALPGPRKKASCAAWGASQLGRGDAAQRPPAGGLRAGFTAIVGMATAAAVAVAMRAILGAV